jgi:hypothetical protein
MSHSILRGIYFVLIKLGDSALHRVACIASGKILLAIITTLRFGAPSVRATDFRAFQSILRGKYFKFCGAALVPICVLHHQQFAGSNSLWIKLPARSAGFDLTVAYFSTSDRKSSCPALLRAIHFGLDFVQTNFCAQISALGVVSGCSLQLRFHTTHLGIETLHSCVAGIVSRLTPCG